MGRFHPFHKTVPGAEGSHEEQTQRHAGDDIGVDHWDVVDRHQGLPPTPAHIVKTDGGKGAHNSRYHCGDQGYRQRGIYTLHNDPVLEQLLIPL